MASPSSEDPAVLVVAETPAASAKLAAVVRARREQHARYTLLVPAVAHGLHTVVDPEDQCCDEAEDTIASLKPPIEAAAGERISTMIGSHEPLAAIEDALNFGCYDEVILAARSRFLSRWLRLDLASKVKALGLPVTVVALGR